MKIKFALGRALGIVAYLMVCNGCVSTWAVKSEPRISVGFASAAGAQIFYEAYIVKNYTRPMGSGLAVAVPAQYPYHHTEFPTDDVYFNTAVREADANHDGLISDEEARRYSEGVRKPPSGLVAVAK